MKLRKNLSLSKAAVARGEKLAKASGSSLSALIEQQLMAIPDDSAQGDYWQGPALKPVDRPGDRRADYLKRKHA